MRPASEVVADVATPHWYGRTDLAEAVIRDDREELVREICEWLPTQWANGQTHWLIGEIERKYLKGSSDGR